MNLYLLSWDYLSIKRDYKKLKYQVWTWKFALVVSPVIAEQLGEPFKFEAFLNGELQ